MWNIFNYINYIHLLNFNILSGYNFKKIIFKIEEEFTTCVVVLLSMNFHNVLIGLP